MPAPRYYVLDVDVSVARAVPQQIIANGEQFDSVTVISFPGGLAASLAFGSNAATKFVPVLFAFQQHSFEDVCGNPFQCDEGLFITNNAVVGTLRLLISTGGNPPTS